MYQGRSDDNYSLTWEEAISFYTDLDRRYPEARLIEMGMTDAGRPLHLFVISGDGEFEPETIRRKGRAIVLINNGIHPGEPEGIDASARFAVSLLLPVDGRRNTRNTVVRIIRI
ncbi:MAG: M14 family zinc carboxypeptidase [Bacteroidales bacterium]|nr:M14 family zinc carboxypeptidase [Bacteroidales bacterium]